MKSFDGVDWEILVFAPSCKGCRGKPRILRLDAQTWVLERANEWMEGILDTSDPYFEW